jgi:phage-related protein
MAGPIKIAIVADAGKATKAVTAFAGDVDRSVAGAAQSLERVGRSTRQAGADAAEGFGRAREGADEVDTKAMGFRDTLTGVQDSMAGTAMIAKGDLFKGFFTLGMGIGDLGSGFANFLIPAVKQAAVAMRALNITMLTNPVFLVIAAIVALVAIFVIAYKKSDTFRKIVDGSFRGVMNAARFCWNWIKGNWPFLLAIITGPIGIAVRYVVGHWHSITTGVKRIPGIIRGSFSSAGSWLIHAGKSIVSGLWNGIVGMSGWLQGKILGWARSVIPGPVARALGIASPSRIAINLGARFGQGLGIGLDQTRAKVAAAAGRLAAATIAVPPGAGTTGAGPAPVVISFEATGDRLLDALLTELRKHVRINGGNVQTVLGQ